MATNDTNGAPEPQPDPPRNQQASGGGGGGGLFNIPTKWLIIGGGGAGAALVAIVAVVVILFLTGVFSGGSPQPGTIMDLVPADARSVIIMDIKAMLADDYLAERLEDDADFSAGTEELEDFGIDAEDIEQIIFASAGGGLAVVKADFDPADVQDALEDEDAEEDDYRGYTLWETADGYGAILDGGYIVGGAERAVKDVLNSLYRGEGALSNADDDSDVKRVLDKLGDGIFIIADVSDACGSRLERCEGYGAALTEADEDREEGSFKYVALFRNERSAENAEENYDSLANFFEVLDLDVDDAEVDGEFVTGTATEDYSRPATTQPSGATTSGSAATAMPAPTTAAMTAGSSAATRVAATIVAAVTAGAPASSLTGWEGVWVEDCVDSDDGFSRRECECLYEELDGALLQVLAYDSPEWEDEAWFREAAIGAAVVCAGSSRQPGERQWPSSAAASGGFLTQPEAAPTATLDRFAGPQSTATPTRPPTPIPIPTVPPTATATPPPTATIRPTNTPVPTPTATPTPTPPPTNTPTPAPTPTATPVPITWQDGCREDNLYTASQCQCIYGYLVERLGRAEVPLYDSDRWVQEERLYTTEEAAYGYCGRR